MKPPTGLAVMRHELSYQISKRRMRLAMWIAWRMPRWLVYWCALRLGAHATQGPYGDQIVPDLLFMDAIKRWEDRR